jgi:hypothetical protein
VNSLRSVLPQTRCIGNYLGRGVRKLHVSKW